MHELHIIKDLIDDLLAFGAKETVKKITKVYVKMGEFTEINEDILRHYFTENTKGTIADSCEVEVESSPTRELRLVSFDCE